MLQPGATAPEEREMPKDPLHIQRLFQRLQHEGPYRRATKRGPGVRPLPPAHACGVTCQVIAPALTPRRREAVRRDVVRWRHRLLKRLDRPGRLWVTEKNWTQRHWMWIRA